MIKGLIFDIRRFTVHDGPGIRTTVFFKGCPLSCWWCHNPESQDVKSEKSIRNLVLGGVKFKHTETTGHFMTVNEVMDEVEKDRVFYEESGGGVTFSGGEPVMQESFLYALLQEAKRKELHTTLDTSGYANPKAMQHVAPLVDLFLYDIKIMDEALHRKYTGVSNKTILENLKFLFSTGKQVTLRLPVIPGITNTPENIRDVKEFISILQSHKVTESQSHKVTESQSHNYQLTIHLLPYHSIAKEKYRRFCKTNHFEQVPDLKKEALLSLKQDFETMGLMVKIGG